jgi:hypothetical protein
MGPSGAEFGLPYRGARAARSGPANCELFLWLCWPAFTCCSCEPPRVDPSEPDSFEPDPVVFLWLCAVDLELLVPAVRRTEGDQSKTAAAAVQKDLINILLANLIREQNSEGMVKAILEALSSAFSKYERAAQKERQGLGDNEGDLGRRMKDRFERLKRQFVDLDQTLGEAHGTAGAA